MSTPAETAAKAPPEKELPPSQRRMNVKVFSPYHILFEGPAFSVSALNARGPFDVLPGHINFFSLLMGGIVRVDTGEEVKEVAITHGILHLRDGRLTLFVFGVFDNEPAESAEE